MEQSTAQEFPFPNGVFFILVSQFCQIYSYFAIKSILELYLKRELEYSDDQATSIFHFFIFCSYLSAILGSVVADNILGNFKTIILLSVLSICGHVINMIGSFTIFNISMPNSYINFIGLLFISLGIGGVRACIYAFNGDQFILPNQEDQLHRYASWMYITINLSILCSSILSPMAKSVNCFEIGSCYPLAFGLSGVMMLLGTIIFVIGKSFYKSVENGGGVSKLFHVICCGFTACIEADFNNSQAAGSITTELYNEVNHLLGCKGLFMLFTPLVMFWALFDQVGSTWTLQATNMNNDFGFFSLHPEQAMLLVPVLSLLLSPVLDHVIYPLFAKKNILTKPLQRICVGGVITASSFFIAGFLQLEISKSDIFSIHIAWQIPQYCSLSLGGLMIVVTIIEFSYNEAPDSFKCLVQAAWLQTVAFGNLVTFLLSSIGGLELADSMFVFGGLMVASMMVFSLLAVMYVPRNKMDNIVENHSNIYPGIVSSVI